ncbi:MULTISPECIES: GTPase Era [Candidatus Phytoplasma]|uniref:GTPase Era n=2 Tax=Candidatus Phytoplasma TaxID=33926 RepID=A0ABN0J8C2_PEWBP|nr:MULTISPECIES: GTPase Era [Phytoplasma]QLL36956.1 GTP-binding protein Era ['Echinacea purpurea' witches'-broom phytoplasma]WEX20327.1 MAG: GTPase Era [Candidatus Phytoplasma aurantifolia]WKV64205.1 MAG: GTP-binding protein Era [Candidatus Phytoplasma australasiaticum]EMR14719.1 GTP-binding protein Era [Peanut witches'-broom phytoplasma NTU2011]MDO8052754.1 GTPase Era ['Vigna radiata' phytoplasma]
MFKSGFISIIGNTNVGKSTLINALINQKISITSYKSQTTRDAIIGIDTSSCYQFIFIDTPGLHANNKYLLNKMMYQVTLKSLNEADVILLVVDREYKQTSREQKFLDLLRKYNKKIILVVNKMDLYKKIVIDKIILSYVKKFNFDAVVPISSINNNNNNINILKQHILEFLPEGENYYPSHIKTNINQNKFISELIREKILYYLHQEIPHASTVLIENISPINSSAVVNISALILIEKNNQKKILIGNQGNMLKKIGIEARKDIEQILNKKIYLDLWVKVEKKWRNNINSLRKIGISINFN